MIKYELIDSTGSVIATGMNDETVFLFAKTYMNDFDQVTIKRIYVEEEFEIEQNKKDIRKEYKDKASAYVNNVIKEEIKSVVEENKEEIKGFMNESTEDIMSLFE